MGAGQSGPEAEGGEESWIMCCDARDKMSAQGVKKDITPKVCGVGMGLDSQLLSNGKGAVVTCLARGGPADSHGVQIGDSLVFVDGLDVRELLRTTTSPAHSSVDGGKAVSSKLANALLGNPGSEVRLGLSRQGEDGVLYRTMQRAPLPSTCQWVSASVSP